MDHPQKTFEYSQDRQESGTCPLIFFFITITSHITVRKFIFQVNTFHFRNWKAIMYIYFAKDLHILLENLLLSYNELSINTRQKQKRPKETNGKQKFQKPKNENVCLT